jgi:hypothetical protein
MSAPAILVNRAPVLTLWAAVVAERLGHHRDEALTLGKAVAGLNAQSKGRRLGIYEEKAPEKGARAAKEKAAPEVVPLLGRAVPVVRTADGMRAAVKGRAENPASVERYLEQKFGERLGDVEHAMRELAKSYPPKRLAEIGYTLYERFRPEIPAGVRGWGAKGRLDLDRIRGAAAE